MPFVKFKQSDGELLILLRSGEADAFTALYERYHRLLYVLAYKYLKDRDASEDAVQQVFLKLWEARSFMEPNMNLRNYLYTMLKNLVLNEIRDRNSAVEKNYVSTLKNYILQNPTVISRMENRCDQMLKNNLSPQRMNQIFFQLAEQEPISFSLDLRQYLMCEGGDVLKDEWGNVLTFLILYAIFPKEINQLYMPYFHNRREKVLSYSTEEEKKDDNYLFQYEYPPDMSIYKPGEWITHTWVIKNVGKVPWKHRRFECINPPNWLEKENKSLEIEGTIYPGDNVSLAVHLCIPDVPGHYALSWKMKNESFLNLQKVTIDYTLLFISNLVEQYYYLSYL